MYIYIHTYIYIYIYIYIHVSQECPTKNLYDWVCHFHDSPKFKASFTSHRKSVIFNGNAMEYTTNTPE